MHHVGRMGIKGKLKLKEKREGKGGVRSKWHG